jgi:hypothetical protein
MVPTPTKTRFHYNSATVVQINTGANGKIAVVVSELRQTVTRELAVFITANKLV